MKNKYLLVKGTGGLGNRMAAFVGACVYSKISGRKLIIDWKDSVYSSDGINSFHYMFDSSIVDEKIVIPKTKSVYPKVWCNCLDRDLKFIKYKLGQPNIGFRELTKIASIDLSKLDYDEDVIVYFSNEFKYDKLKSNLKYLPSNWPKERDDIIRYVLKNFLYTKKEISKEIKKFIFYNFKKPVIGIHIRNSDNMKIGYMSYSLSKYYSKIANIIRNNPHNTIFISTDSKSVLDYLKKKFSNIVYYPKNYPKMKGEPLHLSDYLNKFEVAKSSLIDMYLLSKCDYIISVDRSSYACFARLLSGSDTKIITINVRDIKRNKFICAIENNYYHFLGSMGKILRKFNPSFYTSLKKYFPDG
jgi:hypothetical protein